MWLLIRNTKNQKKLVNENKIKRITKYFPMTTSLYFNITYNNDEIDREVIIESINDLSSTLLNQLSDSR